MKSSKPSSRRKYSRSSSRRYTRRRKRYQTRSTSRHRSTRHKKKKRKKPRNSNSNSGSYDDTIGAYKGRIGDMIASRFEIRGEAGLGTFGRVVECYDTKRSMIVAIKIVRSVEKYTESAKIEADILDDIMDHDRKNQSLCVKLYKRFQFEGHMCLVFEKLGCSLYEYLKQADYKPYPLDCVRAYARQLLQSLSFLHKMKLIHTDLKPENILLVHDDPVDEVSRGKFLRPPRQNDIKVIDFGGATYNSENKSSIISTRQYRAPEVMLGLEWSYPSDIWSAACIIAELYLGDLYFATHENMEHFALIEKAIGPFPNTMVHEAFSRDRREYSKYFEKIGHMEYQLKWPRKASGSKSRSHVKEMKALKDAFANSDNEILFRDLLKQMLVIDPNKRITAEKALDHAFLKY